MAELDFNPMLEPKVEKAYTNDFIAANLGSEKFSDEPIPEFVATKPPVSEQTSANPNIQGDSTAGETPPPQEPPINPDFDNLSASEKKSQAEKTADLILVNYQRIMPIPFVMISSFNMRKMKKLNDKGEIDLKMVVTQQGETIGSYMESHNEKAYNLFQIDDGMVEELRDPLIDVLMEKGVVPTPMQRLGIAVLGHGVKLGQVAFKMYQEKQDDMEVFKKFRTEQIQAMRAGHAQGNTPPTPPQNNNNQHQPTQEEAVFQTETQPSKTTVPVAEEEIIIPPIVDETEQMGIDEYINSDNDDSVIIEEEAVTE